MGSGWLSLVLALVSVLSITQGAKAHEVRPAVANAEVSATEVLIQYRLTVEPLLIGMNLAGLSDTNDSPLSGLYDQLRRQPGPALETRFREAWPALAPKFVITSAEQPLSADIIGLSVPDVGDPELPRDATLILRAALPGGGDPVQIGWDASFGPLVLRQSGEGPELYAALLAPGEISAPLPRDGVVQETLMQTTLRFVVLGIEHIVPKGADHILFVLGLFFFSLALRPLILQISAFTLAHTVTLALASLGYVTVPGNIVEPLIAASIAVVAFENLRGGSLTLIRLAIVFGFGLLHGLGFASVLSELDLPPARFVAGLIAFNIGVEIGQLAVILAAALLLSMPFGTRPWYRRVIVIPASIAIGLTGLYWAIERVFF